jgi:hypothetical protein
MGWGGRVWQPWLACRGMSAVLEVNWKAVVKYGLRSALGVAQILLFLEP